jgi:heparosan-N-sulfate-glucuronate 5-epimerase
LSSIIVPTFQRLRKTVRQDDFWHGTRQVSPHFVPGHVVGYPNDLSAKTQPFVGPVSDLDVPLKDYGPGVGHHLHPVTVCQVALGWHERYLAERNPEWRERFLALADWLMANQRSWAGGGAWPIPVSIRLYGLEAPWVSALVQGQAISVLARAARLRPADGGAAQRAMDAAFVLFEVDVSRGGVRVEDDFGVAFEEYPTPTPSIVLNGLISSLWGVADLAAIQGDGPAHHAFQSGVGALLRRLPRYDSGFWSRYDLFAHPLPNVASPYYHREHLAQLAAMDRLAPDPRWDAMRVRWQRYQDSQVNRLAALAAKAAFRLVVRR